MKNSLTILTGLLCALVSCDDAAPPEPQETTAEEAAASTELGEQLTNPYSLSVMRQALREVREEAGGLKSACDIELEPTHLYVRFAPADSAELFELLADTTLEVFDHPLDRAILSWGEGYHDPELPDSVPTYQYCAAPIGQTLPRISHAVLDSLYQPDVPEDDAEEGAGTLKAAPAFDFDRLERQAYQIAGLEQGLKRSSKYRPEGYLKYEDTSTGATEGIEGAKLRFHYFTKVRRCYTNNQGHFHDSSTFRHDPHCEVQWERVNFLVRPTSGLKVAETHLTGSEKRNFVCRCGTNAWKYASVFRGAHYYYHHWYIGGLTRPPAWGIRHIMIRASNNSDYDHGKYSHRVWMGLGSDIHIYVCGRTSAEIFGTTVHELAHAVHHQNDRGNFHGCSDIVKETWARGVQWYMLTQRYGTAITERAVTFGRNEYTGLVRDLIDGTFTTSKRVELRDYHDRVTGFSIKQIEDIIVKGKAQSWNSLRQKVKNFYHGDKADIDELFNAWAD